MLTSFVFISSVPTEAASGKELMSSLVGGVAAVLNSADTESTYNMICAMADGIGYELGKEEVVVEESNLVMANVSRYLNVREEPTIESTRLGLIYKDCGGIVLEKGDEWTKIQTGNLVGWCSNEFLLFGDAAEELAHDVGITLATVNEDTIRVRNALEDDSEVIGLVPRGEIFEVIGDTSGQFVCVDYDGGDGYISRDCVDITFSIDKGETNEEIRAREEAELEAKRHVNYGEYTTDADTTLLLAALIQCEAGGEPYEGQVAVGSVVMNRVRSPAYPDSIHAVIYASGQFTPALSGRLNAVYESGRIKQSCIDAANETLSGVSNVGDMTHFRRSDGRMGLVIGNHVFY